MYLYESTQRFKFVKLNYFVKYSWWRIVYPPKVLLIFIFSLICELEMPRQVSTPIPYRI